MDAMTGIIIPTAEEPGAVHARAWTSPIVGAPVDFEVRYGATIAEMVAAVPLDDADEWKREHFEVRIAGHLIPRENWHRVRPKIYAAGRPVTVQIGLPVRGKSGRKILMILASILLIALTAGIGQFGIPALGIAAGSVGAKILAAGVALAGNFLLQGLQKAPDPAKPEGSNQLGQSSIGNQFAPGSSLQRVIGRTLIDPKHIVPPWTTITDGVKMENGAYRYSQYSHAILVLAGNTQIGQILIDGVDATDMLDVTTEVILHRKGGPKLANVKWTPKEERVGIEMSGWATNPDEDPGENQTLAGTVAESRPIEHLIETGESPDRVRVEFFASRGWAYTDDNDSYSLGATIRPRIQRWTGSAWGSWTQLPELLIRAKELRSPLRLHLEIVWVDALPASAGNAWPPTNRPFSKVSGWARPFTHAAWTSPLLTPVGTDRWAQWEWESDQVIRLYLLRSAYPQGRWRIGFTRSWPFVFDGFDEATNKVDNAALVAPVSDFFSPPAINDGGNILTDRLRWSPRLSADALTITTILNWWSFYPVRFTDDVVTLIYVRLRDRAASRISVVATTICDSWNGTTWVANQPTDNPADLYRHVLQGPHNAKARSASQVDLPALQDWATWCTAQGHKVGFVADAMTVAEVLSEIALAGFAAPSRGMVESVVPDRARSGGPVGVISGRNSRDQATQFALPNLPHALRVTFADAANDWKVREIAVYFPGYGPTTSATTKAATRFEAVTYRGISSETKARARAQLDINWMLYRTRVRTAELPVERLEYRRGDRVLLHMDMLGTAGGSGRAARIVAICYGTTGKVEAVVVDDEVLYGIEAAPSALTLDQIGDLGLIEDLGAVGSHLTPVPRPIGCVIRRHDGVVETRRTKLQIPASASSYPAKQVVAFETPFTMPVSSGEDRIVEGCLVVTGEINTITRDVLVWNIRPSGDLNAEVEMVDYAADKFYAA